MNGQAVVDGRQIWVQAEKGKGAIWLRIIENRSAAHRRGQAIGEIAKLLKAEPGLRVSVVRHMDAVGGVDAYLKPSQERAKNRRVELVKQ